MTMMLLARPAFLTLRTLRATLATSNDVDQGTTFSTAASSTVHGIVTVPTGVDIGASTTAGPALTTGTSFNSGSRFRITYGGTGRIQGAGGAGGDGQLATDAGGGGGGAAGTVFGLASLNFDPGVNGTRDTGGLGGFSIDNPGGSQAAQAGGVGGVALDIHYNTVLDALAAGANGELYGGGGGGGGGTAGTTGEFIAAGAGGGPALAGGAGAGGMGGAGGLAGKACELNGFTLVQLGSPDVRGTVS